MKKLCLAAILLLSVFNLPAQTVITTPGTIISVPGEYILGNDLNGPTGGVSLRIAASNVSLDLAGHTISGGLTGLVVNNRDSALIQVVNVSVHNGTISNATNNDCVDIFCSNGDFSKLTIKPAPKAVGVEIDSKVFKVKGNVVHVCSIVGPTSGSAATAVRLLRVSQNQVVDCTLDGNFDATFEEFDDGDGVLVTGGNTFSGNTFLHPRL
jgi:hypothetical protein